VAVEMKRAKGGKISLDQNKMHAQMSRGGWTVIIGQGFDDAVAKLKALGYGG
jgi:hypothetical protein